MVSKRLFLISLAILIGLQVFTWSQIKPPITTTNTITYRGEVGPQGLQGVSGINGLGAIGIQGTPGLQGINGTNGTDGKDGVDGVPGKNGTPGENGQDGRETEMRKNPSTGNLEWRYVGDTFWIKLLNKCEYAGGC